MEHKAGEALSISIEFTLKMEVVRPSETLVITSNTLHLEVGGDTLFRNVGSHLLYNTTSLPRRPYFTLKMGTICFSETLLIICNATERHNLGDHALHRRWRRYAPPKHRKPLTKPHDVTTLKSWSAVLSPSEAQISVLFPAFRKRHCRRVQPN